MHHRNQYYVDWMEWRNPARLVQESVRFRMRQLCELRDAPVTQLLPLGDAGAIRVAIEAKHEELLARYQEHMAGVRRKLRRRR